MDFLSPNNIYDDSMPLISTPTACDKKYKEFDDLQLPKYENAYRFILSDKIIFFTND